MHFRISCFSLLLPILVLSPVHGKSWDWLDTPGKHTDLLFGGKKIARYVYENMDPVDRERTYKPFHHIYQENGRDFLTKGPGGKYTHHRGIYFGFSKCQATDNKGKKIKVDTWHCKKGYQVHQKLRSQSANEKSASHEVEIDWRVDDHTTFAVERRKLHFSLLPDVSLQIDFHSTIKTEQELVELDGDPQHAGFQFRAANEVAEKTKQETYYTRPADGKDEKGKTKNWPKDKDMINLLWKSQCIIVGNNRYTTVYLDHPNNPKPAFYSERDYGRFGSYFKTEITPKQPLKVRYRLVINQGEKTARECQGLSDNFMAGTIN